MHVDNVLKDVHDEVDLITEQYGSFRSAHEGLGVIFEEFEELKQEVFMKKENRDISDMRKEALHVAATAVRFIMDICDG